MPRYLLIYYKISLKETVWHLSILYNFAFSGLLDWKRIFIVLFIELFSFALHTRYSYRSPDFALAKLSVLSFASFDVSIFFSLIPSIFSLMLFNIFPVSFLYCSLIDSQYLFSIALSLIPSIFSLLLLN